jgi:hypothetical protein
MPRPLGWHGRGGSWVPGAIAGMPAHKPPAFVAPLLFRLFYQIEIRH